MFSSFGRPLKDQVTEEGEKATGGSSIGERVWTERVKAEEARHCRASFRTKSFQEGSQLHFTYCWSVCRDRNKQKLCLLSVCSQAVGRMRINATLQRWRCLNFTPSSHILHIHLLTLKLAGPIFDETHFAQSAQITKKGNSLKKRSSAAEVFRDRLQKLQLALNHRAFTAALYLWHTFSEASLCTRTQIKTCLFSNVKLIPFVYLPDFFIITSHVLFKLFQLSSLLRILDKLYKYTVTALAWAAWFLLHEGKNPNTLTNLCRMSTTNIHM